MRERTNERMNESVQSGKQVTSLKRGKQGRRFVRTDQSVIHITHSSENQLLYDSANKTPRKHFWYIALETKAIL